VSLVREEKHSLLPPDHVGGSSPSYSGWSSSDEECEDMEDDMDWME
jgi:hypothetical protein